jgi:hypothetical protein
MELGTVILPKSMSQDNILVIIFELKVNFQAY